MRVWIFFSSRRRHTRYIGDWSSDVCSSDLKLELRGKAVGTYFIGGGGWYYRTASLSRPVPDGTTIGCVPAWVYWGYECSRSEERRVGKECRLGWEVEHEDTKISSISHVWYS